MTLRPFKLSLLVILVYSCSKEDTPEPKPFTTGNFGTVISFSDTMRVYDANAGTLNIKSGWYGSLPGSFYNNVTINDNTIAYQAGYTGLVGVNIKTGAFFKRLSQSGYTGFNSIGGVSSCWPVIEGDKIFYIMGDYYGNLRLYCVNKTNGSIVWKSPEDILYDYYSGYYPSIEVTNDRIITNMQDGPACFDKNTGKLLWRNNSLRDFEKLNGFPKVYANSKILVLSRKKVYCLDINNGNILWNETLSGGNLYREPFLMDSILVCNSNYLDYPNSQHGFLLDFINVNTGKIVKKYSNPSDDFFDYEKGFFYAGARLNPTAFPQQLVKYDMASLSPVWKVTLEGGFSTGFTITPDYLYCTEVDPINTSSWQKLTILNKQNGDVLKSFPLSTNVYAKFTVKYKDGRVYGTLKGQY